MHIVAADAVYSMHWLRMQVCAIRQVRGYAVGLTCLQLWMVLEAESVRKSNPTMPAAEDHVLRSQAYC